MTKNSFYSILKAPFFHKIFKVLSWENDSIKRLRTVLKFMTSQPGNKQLQYTYCPIIHEVNIVYDFSKKICGSYSINWFSLIVRLHLLLEILGNVCIMITSYLAYEVINFQIKLSFLIKPFIYMTKMSGQKSLWTKFHKQRDLFGVYKKLCSFHWQAILLSEIISDLRVHL